MGFGLVVFGVAHAACEKESAALAAAKDAAVAPAFTALAICNRTAAGDQFATVMKQASDVDSLVALAQAALAQGMEDRVHTMLDPIAEYATRTEITRLLGARCADDPRVLAFVVGLHGALKDRAFVSWSGALETCPSDDVTAQLETLASYVPSRGFDDKYARVVELYAERKGVASLPVLEKAAATAVNGGPFPVVVDAMVGAVTPAGIGAKPADDDRAALVASLQRVAGSATPDQVTKLADTFVAVGAGDAAASLLPRIYPDRLQAGGGFLYGVAAVEQCDGAAVVHFAVVEEPGKRWSIQPDVDAPANAFKPKLKCKSPAPYALQVTPGPVHDRNEVASWAESVAAQTKVPDAKVKEEAAILLR